ncbi:MAG: FkbM family methyltransferase [Gammaproteobacteria bacterium]|nr:FkbM family methyltransferase [Gammaproteobacteria bacterium]
MQDVGESRTRNEDFKRIFSRSTLIRNLVGDMSSPLIIDVGGHSGESVVYLRSLFPDAIIHTFEPDPQSFEELSRLSDKKTHCYNVAVSDCDGESVFFRNEVSHTNSLYKVNLDSKDSIFFNKVKLGQESPEFDKFNRELNVAVRRLDGFCIEQDIQRIDLLKIDVQGAEAKVLIGANGILGCVENVILEVSFFDYYEHQSSFLEIEQALMPFGFRLFSISEISNNPMNGRTDWAEVIYRKQRSR